MAQQCGDGFAEMLFDLLQDALGNPLPPPKPIATWGTGEVGITSSGDANFPDSDEFREAVAVAYEYAGDHQSASRVRMCAFFRRGFVFECGIVEGRP